MSLTFYGSTVANSTLTSAATMALASGGVETSSLSSFAGAGTYGEIYALGGSPVAVNSIPATPTGNGWIYALGAGGFTLGNWSASFAHSALVGTVPVDFTIRFFKYSGGVYTLIGSSNVSATTATTRTVFTFPATALAAVSFDTPDYLYVDLWEHDTTGVVGDDDATIYLSTSSTAGVTNDLQITTPDFTSGSGSGILDPTVFGTNTHNTTIATADIMALTTGGTEVALVTTYSSGSGNFGEIYAQGNGAAPAVAAIPASPTGHGWVYQPGAGTLLAGVWSASITLLPPNNAGNWSLRFFKYSGGSYTSIGSIASVISAFTKTIFAFAATAMPAVTLASTDLIYIDLWYQDTAGAVGDSVSVYVSNAATQGVANDMQVTTANFLPDPINSAYIPRVGGSTLVRTFVPRTAGSTLIRYVGLTATGIALAGETDGTSSLAGTLSLTTALATSLDGIAVLTPALSAAYSVTGTTLDGTSTLTGTSSVATALTTTLTGVGTVTMGSPTFATALSSTENGVGVLSPTLSANITLSGTTLTGSSTLTGSFTESTALTTTLAGIGTLAGTITTPGSIALSCTLTGVGVFTASAPTFATALTTTIPASGILTGTIGATTPLTSTLVGSSTLVSAWTLKTALSTTIASTGTLNSTIQAATTFSSVTFIGAGVLSGAAAYATHLSQTIVGNGVLNPTFKATAYLSVLCMGVGACFPSPSFAGVVYIVEVYAVAMSSMITIQSDDVMTTTVAVISSPQES